MFHILLQIKFIFGVNDSDYKGGILNNKSKMGKTKLLNKGVWRHWSMLSNQCALIFNERRGKGNQNRNFIIHYTFAEPSAEAERLYLVLLWSETFTQVMREMYLVEDPVCKKI